MEKSFGGRKFIKIGEVAARARSSEGSNYTYTDVNLPELGAFSYFVTVVSVNGVSTHKLVIK